MVQTENTKEKIAAIWNKRPMVIAGPCSAETEEQVIATALELQKLNRIDVMRAGIWKPRTKPGNFEGIGVKGLPWMVKARDLTGIPIAVEVATAKHVEDALSFGVDILWIGARTTVNPFSVQEVADALRGVDVPVFIKNPINPDVELWIGAIERIANAGIKQIGLIHRGFSSAAIKDLRNAPMWHIPIEMKTKFPTMPLLCDPSHICGRREPLLEIAQRGINLDFDGLIIESHINPDAAWSDAKQQLTPQDLGTLLNKIVWRQEAIQQEDALKSLSPLREEINHLDDEIINILVARMNVAEKIGMVKKNANATILQPGRWTEILKRLIAKGTKAGLSQEFVEKLLESIHIESIQRQNKVLEK